jgi:hypothetical protein
MAPGRFGARPDAALPAAAAARCDAHALARGGRPGRPGRPAAAVGVRARVDPAPPAAACGCGGRAPEVALALAGGATLRLCACARVDALAALVRCGAGDARPAAVVVASGGRRGRLGGHARVLDARPAASRRLRLEHAGAGGRRCVHQMRVRDVFRPHRADPPAPFRTAAPAAAAAAPACAACGAARPRWRVHASATAPADPCDYCDPCFDALHFAPRGGGGVPRGPARVDRRRSGP